MSLDIYFRNLFREIIEDLIKETSSKQTLSLQETINQTQTIQNPYYSIKQSTKYLGCSENTLRRWITDGKLKVVKLSERMYRIRKSDLDKIGNITDDIDTTKISQDITQDILNKML